MKTLKAHVVTAEDATAHDLAHYDGSKVTATIYSRGGVLLATVTGKIKVEKGSFAFEVWGSGGARVAFPYRTADKAKVEPNGRIRIFEGDIQWLVG